ncbi:hypothetical protein FHS38_006560 [Streptomyces netropsis]|uniref:Uncharacterized protein n=1 Tax=Streptomyces netropsis TaxID=55404 RepID=A0A7W7LHV0_STRNE|nr:hypothetical protein [Streptomyces netropsis]
MNGHLFFGEPLGLVVTAADRAQVPVAVMTRSLRYGQALGEQVDDVAPGSLRVPWVEADAGDHGVVDRRVVEGVQHVKRRVADPPHPVGVGEQRHAPGQHLLGVAQIAPAVEVEGQRHVTQLGERIGPATL